MFLSQYTFGTLANVKTLLHKSEKIRESKLSHAGAETTSFVCLRLVKGRLQGARLFGFILEFAGKNNYNSGQQILRGWRGQGGATAGLVTEQQWWGDSEGRQRWRRW